MGERIMIYGHDLSFSVKFLMASEMHVPLQDEGMAKIGAARAVSSIARTVSRPGTLNSITLIGDHKPWLQSPKESYTFA